MQRMTELVGLVWINRTELQRDQAESRLDSMVKFNSTFIVRREAI